MGLPAQMPSEDINSYVFVVAPTSKKPLVIWKNVQQQITAYYASAR